MSLPALLRLVEGSAAVKNAAIIAQYEFIDGQLEGKIAFDHNHRLLLRVMDDDEFISRHNETQSDLIWKQRYFPFWYTKDRVKKITQKNSRELREFLKQQLEVGRVYRQAHDLQTGDYRFRLVNAEELPALRRYLACEHKYQLYFRQGDDPTAISLIHRDIFPA